MLLPVGNALKSFFQLAAKTERASPRIIVRMINLQICKKPTNKKTFTKNSNNYILGKMLSGLVRLTTDGQNHADQYIYLINPQTGQDDVDGCGNGEYTSTFRPCLHPTDKYHIPVSLLPQSYLKDPHCTLEGRLRVFRSSRSKHYRHLYHDEQKLVFLANIIVMCKQNKTNVP
jgi:uncharacterized Zn-finger protein